MTRHIDVKHHIVRDAVDEGLVRIVCVKSEDQHAGILAKGSDMRISKLHAKALMNVKQIWEGFRKVNLTHLAVQLNASRMSMIDSKLSGGERNAL